MPENFRIWQTALLAMLIILLLPKNLADQGLPDNIFIDDGNRQIMLPPEINKVYATTENGLFLLYSIKPEAIMGWNRGLSPELAFAVEPEYHNLPTLGTWDKNYQTAQLDVIKRLKPDLIIHYAEPDVINSKLADEISELLDVPAILLDSSLKALPRSLEVAGQLLGKEIRGQALASYVQNSLKQIQIFQAEQRKFAPIPVHIVSSQPPGYYDELLSFAGMVEMEVWNDYPPFPDYVLIMPHSFLDPYQAIERDGHKRIFQVPIFPSNWLEPGSPFSLLGVHWLNSLAHARAYAVDLKEAYGIFMEIFFQLDLTPELLSWTLQRSGINY